MTSQNYASKTSNNLYMKPQKTSETVLAISVISTFSALFGIL
jgi:hypothetical protein